MSDESNPQDTDPATADKAKSKTASVSAAPPAAKTVVEGAETEEVNTLRKRVRELEGDVAGLQDKNRQLKSIPAEKKPKSQPGFFERLLDVPHLLDDEPQP